MTKINLYQKQQIAEVLGNLSIAVLTIGAINPLFTQKANLILISQLIVTSITAIIIEGISFLILKK